MAIHLRIPAWADGAMLLVNGEPAIETPAPGTYATVKRVWQAGDVIQLDLPMHPRRIISDPRIADTAGKVALARGPLIYCLEQADHGETDVRDIALPSFSEIDARHDPGLLGGIVTLHALGHIVNRSTWQRTLYATAPVATTGPAQSINITAIPYYAWANRQPGSMTVWMHAGG